jgi:hypothetical protein
MESQLDKLIGDGYKLSHKITNPRGIKERLGELTQEPYEVESINEVVLRLKKNGDHSFIEAPSGEPITASMLEEGVVYLHNNLLFYREIMQINGNRIVWCDEFGLGSCTKQSFVRVCPTIATKSELDFLKGNLDG